MLSRWALLLQQVEARNVLVVGEVRTRRIVRGRLHGADPCDETLLRMNVRRRHEMPGGAAAVAAALALAEANVTLCGLVGDDPAGCTLLKRLTAEGVDTRAVICDPGWRTAVLTEMSTADPRRQAGPLLESRSEEYQPPTGDTMARLHQAAEEAAADAQWLFIAANGPRYMQSLLQQTQQLAAERDIEVAVAPTYLESSLLNADADRTTKLFTLKELLWVARQQRDRGASMVFTNGCFDLLHAGHAKYLKAAADQGDYLIVAMNSDSSVRAVKGPGRPILDEQQRAELLSALACVDAVLVFSTDDVCPLLEALRPEVYVKGGDYTIDTINQDERRVVEGYGGRIVLVPGEQGASTTEIIRKIQMHPQS